MQPLLGSSIQWSCKQYFPILFMCTHWYIPTYVYYIYKHMHLCTLDVHRSIFADIIYIDGQTGAPACNGAISYNDIVGICMSMPCTVTYVNTVSGWNTRHTIVVAVRNTVYAGSKLRAGLFNKSDRIKQHAFPMLQRRNLWETVDL